MRSSSAIAQKKPTTHRFLSIGALSCVLLATSPARAAEPALEARAVRRICSSGPLHERALAERNAG